MRTGLVRLWATFGGKVMRFAISEDGVQIGSLYAKVKDVIYAANDWSMDGWASMYDPRSGSQRNYPHFHFRDHRERASDFGDRPHD